ncbi:MAG: hypothetical protein IAF38_04200 [Bacteroidia bacterium]|nr:hypothetical protein [Bacteroidia bacterium]
MSEMFNSAPYLLPWYLKKQEPLLQYKNNSLNWEYIEKIDGKFIGIVKLCDEEKTLGLFNSVVYVHASTDGLFFCIWKRLESTAGLQKIELYSVNDLSSITDEKMEMQKLIDNYGSGYLLTGKPLASVSFTLLPEKEFIEVEFPEEFKMFDEFFYTTDIPGLYQNANPDWTNTAILSVVPKENKIYIFPQDWYNQSEQLDKGYQWITRATRNAETGKIIGQGIRMNNFELDESGRRF